MAFITDTRTATVSLADRASALMATVVTAYETRKMYRTTFSELQNLSNRELADLGIHRSSIRSIAMEASKK